MNLELPLKLPSRRPLIPLEGVVTLCDLDPISAAQACEQGLLGWVWDLGSSGARRELRVWRGSVEAWLRSGGREGGAGVPEPEVLADILPGRDLRSSEVWRRLGISRQHLTRLMSELVVARPARECQGVNAACWIARDSLVRMLRARRVAGGI